MKPSEILQAMLDGVNEAEKRTDFVVEMGTFGSYLTKELGNPDSGKICFGCAATCAVQKLSGKCFQGEEIQSEIVRAKYTGWELDDIGTFEESIDDARKGWFGMLFSYCGLKCIDTSGYGSHIDPDLDYKVSPMNWKGSMAEAITRMQADGY